MVDDSRLDVIVERTVRDRGMVGLAAGVAVDGRPAYVRTIGLADVEHGGPVTPTTLFRIASISKTFTAIAIMQLVEEGRLGLDDPVNDHLKHFRVLHKDSKVSPVLVRHLLTHTSGLTEPPRLRDFLQPSRVVGPKDGQRVPTMVQLMAPVLRPRVAPEVEPMYSNYGFVALGQMVEDIVGRPFADHVDQQIFEPLGMQRTTFQQGANMGPEYAIGYSVKRAKSRPVTFRHAWLPAGGVSSSTDDMLTYAAALVGGGANQHGRVLRPETLQSMYEPRTWLGDRVPLQGWCFFLGQEGKHRSVYHYGDLFGFESALLAAPDQRITVVVLVNRQSRGGAQRLGIDLLREVLGLPAPPSVDASESHTSPDIAAAVSGDYKAVHGPTINLRSFALTGGRLRVRNRGGALFMQGRFGPLRSPVQLMPINPEDPLWFRFNLRGFAYDDMPLDVVFAGDGTGRISRLDVGLLGSRFRRVRG